MGPGVILIVGASSRSDEDQNSLRLGPAECVEIAGRSVLERMVERCAAVDAETISILAPPESCAFLRPFRSSYSHVTFHVVRDIRTALKGRLATFYQRGIQHCLVAHASTYVESDFLDLICFHRESRQLVTPTFSGDGPLSFWAVNCDKWSQFPASGRLEDEAQISDSKYFVREYVNQVTDARQLRKLASDILARRCEAEPSGRQVRPGVWMDERAEVHKRARIVAPAYIGCESKVHADALITRLSNLERNSRVESGTVIEDSSILENTCVGICLDVCHAVANGNRLLNLERDVVVEISDSKVMSFISGARKPVAVEAENLEETVILPELNPVPRVLATGDYLN